MNSRQSIEPPAPDRFSDLPEHLVHHILSFLPTKDVAKTGFLSKKFMSISSSYPILDFDYESSNLPEDEFLSYINSTVQRRSQQEEGFVLQKFRLSLEGGFQFPDHCIDKAISYAVRNNVKELDLVSSGQDPLLPIVFCKSVTTLSLSGFRVKNLNELILGSPQLKKLDLACPGFQDFKLSSNKIKSVDLGCLDLKRIEIESSSLESLRFVGMSSFSGDLSSFNISNCRFLKVLSLYNAPVTDHWVETVVPQFQLLETMELSCCHQLKIFEVSNYNLKKINLICCERLEIIEVRVKNLESFQYVGIDTRHSSAGTSIRDIDISACKHLKNLRLSGNGIPKGVLQEQVPKLLELDCLELDLSSFTERIEINHENLKKLDLCNPAEFRDDREIKIHTPGLVSFGYRCEVMPLLSLDSETTLHATLKVLQEWKLDAAYFLQWYEFIRFFGRCKILTLACTYDQELIFPHDLREKLTPPLIDLKHMRIEIPRISTELIDSLLWLSPYLETLVFESPESTETLLSLKFEYRRTINKEGNTLCSSYHPTEYYSFKTVEMEGCDGLEEKDNFFKLFEDKAKSLRSISCE